MNNSKTILALVFLVAGVLLTTTAITTIVPAAYADNKQKAEDESAAAIADCDHNDVEEAGFECFGIAANDIEIEEESEPPCPICIAETATATTETEETGIMSNPLFNLGQNSTG